MQEGNKRYFMFNADPEAVRRASEATDIHFTQEFTLSLSTDKIHEFSQAAGGVAFFVPPSERREGLCPYIIRGDFKAVKKTADQWGLDIETRSNEITRNKNTMSLPGATR